MKKQLLIFVVIVLSLFVVSYGQQPLKENEFIIGMFGSKFKIRNIGECKVPYITPLDQNNYKTSTLNVLSEDGFNVFQSYAPIIWTSEAYLKNILRITAANNMMMEVGAIHFYKPDVDENGNYLGTGTNIYDNCGHSIDSCHAPYVDNYFRPHYDDYFKNVYTKSPYKDIIWGHHVSEESSYWHPKHSADDCVGNNVSDTNLLKGVEVPPANVKEAISHFKNACSVAGIKNQKMVVMEASHHKNIHDGTVDGQGIYNPQDYIKLLNKNDKRDVFFEGSYTIFPSALWTEQNYSNMFTPSGYHYLGPIKSIDYAKKYASQVHKVVSTIGNSDNPNVEDNKYLWQYHTDINIPNANWLWFQAYTSIIHGAVGVWFWDLNYSWAKNEINHWGDTTIQNRFDREYFPIVYKNYVTFLAKELRFLVDKNIISSDGITVVATKTDVADRNCIVPPAKSYIPTHLPSEKRTEHYGLRYTIRSNGQETYMIISNPLNVAVNVSLNFANSSNKQIQNSTGVDVLFETNLHSVTSNNYKVDRNSNINLTDGTVGSQYYIEYTSNKQLKMSFGPMDVKVLKFKSVPFSNGTGWDLVWSNFGNGYINGCKVKDVDLFYIGDFDGDGTEELLCVGYAPNGGNGWLVVLKYVNNNWQWYWSNYGSPECAVYPYSKNFIVGDFDGDGKDELLGNYPNGWTTLFKFNNGKWSWAWSDYGNASHPIRPYKDKMYVGDFNGNGKDELLCCDLPTGETKIFRWNGSDFVSDLQDYGIHQPIKPFVNNLIPGDFDGDGKIDILGLGSSKASLFHFKDGNWQPGLINYHTTDFSGLWSYPLLSTDRILVGNFSSGGGPIPIPAPTPIPLQTKDDLFLLQTHPEASQAVVMQLKNDKKYWISKWYVNSGYDIPSIYDWPLASNEGNDTKYFAIKLKKNAPKHLMAMRKFCDNYLVSIYERRINLPARKENEVLSQSSIPLEIENDIQIFPNPSNGIIEVFSNIESISEIEIYDIRGQIIWKNRFDSEQKNVHINLSNTTNGLYLMKLITGNNHSSIHKIILKK